MKFPAETKDYLGCTASLHVGRPVLTKAGIKYEGEVWQRGRLSYHLNVAPIDRTPQSRDQVLQHHCEHYWCVEPSHLYLGTASVFAMRKKSASTKAKIALKLRGSKKSEETRRRMSEAHKKYSWVTLKDIVDSAF